MQSIYDNLVAAMKAHLKPKLHLVPQKKVRVFLSMPGWLTFGSMKATWSKCSVCGL